MQPTKTPYAQHTIILLKIAGEMMQRPVYKSKLIRQLAICERNFYRKIKQL